MEEIRDVLVLLAAVAVALPGVYVAVKKRLVAELQKRLDKISGGKVSTLEDLVDVALQEKRLREETPVAVHGTESLWAELRRGGFAGASVVSPEERDPPERPFQIAVVDAAKIPKERIATLQERYVLIYKEGKPYDGALPPGAEVTYANSHITLDARLMEALRFMKARS